MDKKKKNILIIIMSLIIIVLSVAGTTYAWYVWRSADDQKTTIITGVGAATVYYNGGSSIIGVGIRPVSDRYNGIVKDIQIKTDYAGMQTFDLYLDIEVLDEELKHESFRFAVYNGTTLIKEGNFSNEYLSTEGNTADCAVNTGLKHIQLLSEQSVTKTTTTYTVYIWIDGANYTNPTEMQNKNFSFNLHASGKDAIIQEGEVPDITETIEGTLAYNLVSLYNRSKKTAVTNNSIIYYYDYEHNLMSDVGGNVRYYGAEPNNFIYFNCSDYSNQSSSTCEIWRIIGVFEGKVKIMRNSNIGAFSWDTSVSTIQNGYGINDWSTADLMKLLNPSYENNQDLNNSGATITVNNSLYWNSGSGTCYSGYNNATKSCDFTSTGLKNDITRNLISETLWYLNGWNSYSVYSNQIYNYERTTGKVVDESHATSWYGRIGLPYPSDYGYAADFNSCTSYISSYNSNICKSVNWMYNRSDFKLLTPYSNNYYYSYYVDEDGNVNTSLLYNPLYIFPTLYLNSDQSIKTGEGSIAAPYQLSVE